jgi:IclR family transcriptional regulator, acetate operon repressor
LGTVHRLLVMLVYRDFAVQDHDRSYAAGPALAAPLPRNEQLLRLQQVAMPYLELLSESVGETFNFMVRSGTAVRVIASVEGSFASKVGSRQNAVLPATSTSGGRALLAALPDEWLRRLFTSQFAVESGTSLSIVEFQNLIADLQQVRKLGYSKVYEHTESGVAALGFILPGSYGEVRAALSMSVPSRRANRLDDPSIHLGIKRALRGIEEDLVSPSSKD